MELKQPILETKRNGSVLEGMSQKNRITSKVLQSQERTGDNDESSLSMEEKKCEAKLTAERKKEGENVVSPSLSTNKANGQKYLCCFAY